MRKYMNIRKYNVNIQHYCHSPYYHEKKFYDVINEENEKKGKNKNL